MVRGIVLSLFAAVALAQIQYKEDPVQAAISAYQTARNQGHFEEAAAKREQARGLLDRVPVDSPQYGNSVRRVAQMYQNAGMSAKGLALAQQALARATDDNRIGLLGLIADFYQQDRNLLQCVAYREKVVAAMDEVAAKPAKQDTNGPYAARVRGDFNGGITFRTGLISMSRVYRPMDARTLEYQQLARLYQQLGRPDAVAAITKRMAAIAKDPGSVAQFYEQRGQFEEAAAIYKKQTEQADAPARSLAFQSLASLYQQQQRYNDAAEYYRQAIATVTASGKPEEAIWLRTNLAGTLHQAGQIEAADQVFEQLLADTANLAGSEHLQVVMNYANYLGGTKRDAQAAAMLTDFLASHASLQPYEEANLLSQLSNIARRSGDAKLADEYQQASLNKQQRTDAAHPEQILIGKQLQAALEAVNAGRLDEAFGLSLQAMDAAPGASDREQVSWQIPNIATGFVNKKQAGKAEQLYQRLFSLVESWAADNPQPLLEKLQNYANFLSQSDRWHEAPAVIKRHRDLLVSMHGATSGLLADSYQLTMQFERMHGSLQATIVTAQELLALEESLSGKTSEPYLRGLEGLAREYQSGGDLGRAVPILRQTISIGDLVFPGANPQRAHIRMNAAMAFAQQRQFDEAEQLATEAIAIGQAVRPPQGDMFANQLAQIRKMREAPATNPNRAANPWFTPSKAKD